MSNYFTERFPSGNLSTCIIWKHPFSGILGVFSSVPIVFSGVPVVFSGVLGVFQVVRASGAHSASVCVSAGCRVSVSSGWAAALRFSCDPTTDRSTSCHRFSPFRWHVSLVSVVRAVLEEGDVLQTNPSDDHVNTWQCVIVCDGATLTNSQNVHFRPQRGWHWDCN